MMSEHMRQQVKEIGDHLLKMNPEDLNKLMEAHSNGDFARILRECGALDIIDKKEKTNDKTKV